jgi:tetratricopeptide (TPR) repeat protein
MVGREREAAALSRAWAGAQVAAVIGEAGMGKTRLLADFIDTQRGIVRAAGRPGDAGVPFATLARLLRAIDGQPAASLSTDTRNQLARVLPELGSTGAVFPEGQRLHLQRAMLAFVQAAPGLHGLVLDDLHFADQASLEMLQSLIVESPEPRWGLAWRPAEAGSPVHALEAALAEAAMLVPVVVAPLGQQALAELVDDLHLGVEGDSLAPQLLQRTGGNPLFVLETLKQAWVDDRIRELAQGGQLPRPLSVGQLMDRRVAQLSAPAVALARVASIAGVDFSLDLAEQVLDTRAMNLVNALNELEAAQVLKGLQFAHDLIFDAVLASVPPSVARHTHARTAAFMSQRQAEPARIAEHWLQAGQPLDALPWLKSAAAAAKRAGRGRERAEFLLRAADVEERFGTPAAAFDLAIQVLHDELHSFVADPMSVVATLQRLASTDRQRALASGAQAWRLNRDWRQDEARPHAMQSLMFAERSGELALINDARHQLAVTDAMGGHNERALPWFEKVNESVKASGDPAPEDFYANYAMTLDNLGRVRESWTGWRAVLAEEARAGCVTPISLSNAAINRQIGGQGAVSRQLSLDSLAAHAQSETTLPERVPPALILARTEQLLGHWQRALRLLHGLDPADVAQNKFYVWSHRLRQAESWLDLGQFARAIAELVDLGSQPEVFYKFSVTAHCELARARRWAGLPLGDCLDQASALRPPGSAAELRLRIPREMLHVCPASDVLAGTEPVLSEAQALGLDGIVMTGWWLRAARLRDVAPDQAAEAAERALLLAVDRDAYGLYKPELWWHAALALQSAGNPARAAGVVRQAAAWVHDRVKEGDVPPEFIDSFLHRNPINRELLAWCGRLEAEMGVTPT